MAHPDRYLLAGIMGWPVMHSRSPKLHNYWLQKHGLAGAYVPLGIQPMGLIAALRALPALGFSGCNITIPHKIHAMEAMDELSPTAKRIGAMNCVVVRPDGALYGTNYDGYGYIESVKEAAPDWRAGDAPITVLGAGGGSRAVLVGLIDAGATEIRLTNRSRHRAEQLAADLGGPIRVVDWESRSRALEGAAMLVNTTSNGMVGQPELDIALDALPGDALVSDIVYAPLETKLLAAARRRGNRCVDGLGMLLHQARPAFRDWFGILPEVTKELRASIVATL